ncbi:MAG TPA: hypothetical protein VEL76_08980 [Gemmataceae bacterium]|nr:hypothetical protein [Gemmataceae bacterium]
MLATCMTLLANGDVMSGALRGALIGGAVGAVVGLVIWLVRKGQGGDKS